MEQVYNHNDCQNLLNHRLKIHKKEKETQLPMFHYWKQITLLVIYGERHKNSTNDENYSGNL